MTGAKRSTGINPAIWLEDPRDTHPNNMTDGLIAGSPAPGPKHNCRRCPHGWCGGGYGLRTRLRQPPIIGYILAGLVLRLPTGFGIVHPFACRRTASPQLPPQVADFSRSPLSPIAIRRIRDCPLYRQLWLPNLTNFHRTLRQVSPAAFGFALAYDRLRTHSVAHGCQ